MTRACSESWYLYSSAWTGYLFWWIQLPWFPAGACQKGRLAVSTWCRHSRNGPGSYTFSYSTVQYYNYYSFKIFSLFWLVKTTRIIHHNQLLFTKFGENLRHIESMTSKVQPAENYWTDDVKMTSKVQPAADYWTVDWENLETRLCYIWWAEKQRA